MIADSSIFARVKFFEKITMKKYFLLLFLSILLVNCQNKEDYELKGEAIGYDEGTKILVQTFSFKDNFAVTKDTLTVKNGKFSAFYKVPIQPSMNILRVENEQFNIIYFPEDTDLKVTIDKKTPQNSKVTGGKQNKIYNDYVEKNNEFLEKRQDLTAQFQRAQESGETEMIPLLQSKQLNMMEEEADYRREFLKSNPNSIFGIIVLSGMVDAKEINSNEALKYLNDVESGLAQVTQVDQLKAKLEKMKKADIGAKAPEFSGPTPEGETLALTDVLGKYTIIDFWASWCVPCRKENPNIVKAYEKYHDKGLNIIGVSLDRDRNSWLKAIEDDRLDWYQISHLQFWNDPIIGDYNVRSIPAAFLLDEKGVIIDKDVRGEALQVKLASLFKDE